MSDVTSRQNNAFDITGPSVIAGQLDPIRGKLTRGQVATLAVQRKEAREGKSPGSVTGISRKADEQIRRRRI